MYEDDYTPGPKTGDGHNRLVVISGCSGGGKSTLLGELAQRGHAVFPEPGRQIVREQTLIGGDALPWMDMDGFVAQCVARAIHFHTQARPEAGPVFFDRSLIDAVAAFEAGGRALPASYRNAVELCRYASVVFLAPPWENLFTSDNERRHAFPDAVSEYERLLRAYTAYGYEPVILPKASVTERIEFVEAELKRCRL